MGVLPLPFESDRIAPADRAANGTGGGVGEVVFWEHPTSATITASAEKRVRFILPSSKVATRLNQVYAFVNRAVKTTRNEFVTKMIVVR